MLVGNHLPKFGTDLVTALASLNMDNLSHILLLKLKTCSGFIYDSNLTTAACAQTESAKKKRLIVSFWDIVRTFYSSETTPILVTLSKLLFYTQSTASQQTRTRANMTYKERKKCCETSGVVHCGNFQNQGGTIYSSIVLYFMVATSKPGMGNWVTNFCTSFLSCLASALFSRAISKSFRSLPLEACRPRATCAAR